MTTMNKYGHIQKIKNMLSDNTKFTRLEDKSAEKAKVERKVINETKILSDGGLIDEAVANKLKPVWSPTQIMNGLPKAHKQGSSMRPILSMINSSFHILAK